MTDPERAEKQAARSDIAQSRPSFYAVGAALLALGTLAITAQGLPLLGVFGLAILLSRFTTVRLRDHAFLRWPLRILLIALIWMLTPDVYNAATEAMGSAHTRNLFGEICAAEMTLQFWRYRSYDPKRSNLILLLMTGLTFLTASNAYESPYVRFLTPLFLVFLGLMARDYRVRVPSARTFRRDRATQEQRRPPLFPTALRLIALFAALGIGWVGYTEINTNKSTLTELSNRVLFKSSWEMDMGGMSAQPELGSSFGLRGSAERVLRLENFEGDPHLDGVSSYTDYSMGRWGPAVNQLAWRNATEVTLRPNTSFRVRGPATNVIVTRLVSDNPLLYLPLNTADIDLGDVTTATYQGTLTGGPFRVRAPAPLVYNLTVPHNIRYQGILTQAINPEERAKCLVVPPQDVRFPPEVAALARRIVGKRQKSADKVEAITRYLMLHHDYSLNYRRNPGSPDPIADFLLSSPPKAAHCVFFATGAALLLRCVGVPTRYVTGYYVHEEEGVNTMVVRQRDAHAWCEAWVDGTGWVTVDATPGDGKPDALEGLTPVEPWRHVLEWLQDKMQAIMADLANITPLQIGIGMAITVALGAGGWFIYGMLRRRRLGTVAAEVVAHYTTAADATLGELSRRFEAAWQNRTGIALPTNRTYAEYLRRLPAATDAPTVTDSAGAAATPPTMVVPPEVIAAAQVFARLYEAARFGGPAALDDARRAEMAKALELLEEKKTTA